MRWLPIDEGLGSLGGGVVADFDLRSSDSRLDRPLRAGEARDGERDLLTAHLDLGRNLPGSF
ncbi:MAG: hypothetical protein ACREQ9_06375 [Candidatus Binatia bacterium]